VSRTRRACLCCVSSLHAVCDASLLIACYCTYLIHSDCEYLEQPQRKCGVDIEDESPLSPTSLFRHRPAHQHGNACDDPLAGELTPVLVRFGKLLREIAQAQDMCMSGLQQSFVDPLDAYCRDALGSLTATKKAAANAADAHSR
jgi:hypothetical protein